MHLTEQGLKDTAAWASAGITLPRFDRAAVRHRTQQSPTWVHFGAGNIFRAFLAPLQQQLLEQGEANTGIVAAVGHNFETVDQLYKPHDNLSLLVTLKVDGSIDKTVIASIVEALRADSAHAAFARLREIFRAPSLQMVSLTITEKGYQLRGGDGAPHADVAADFLGGPSAPGSYIGRIAALLHERYLAGRLPLALVSMDNCSHNGDRLREAVTAFADAWTQAGLADAGFSDYIADPAAVSFPWSMIDKITPGPDDGVRKMLLDCGFDAGTHSRFTPFVNAEETQYLVIEDHFPAGRPPLEKAGVIFTDRETVDKVEKMKVCTCLNPLHTALAIFGCLLGYTRISDEMQDADLVALIERIVYREGLPVVVDPGIIDPRAFLENVLRVRFPNPFMPDTPQRIAMDTSQKLPIRFGETIKAYQAHPELQATQLEYIPLVFAAWLRYLMGVNDAGDAFEISADPRGEELSARAAQLTLGNVDNAAEVLEPILRDAEIFGQDLVKAGLSEKVLHHFAKMAAGAGAVRQTLHEMVSS